MRAAFATAAESEPVAAFLIDVKVEGHGGFAQGVGEVEGVLHLHRVVFPGVPEEGRRRVFGDLLFVGEKFDELGRGVFAEQVFLGTAVRVGCLLYTSDAADE